MDWWLVFGGFLYFICAVLIVAEIFIPSGGLISICSLICLIGGLMIFFNQSTKVGMIGIAVALIMIPLVLLAAYKIFPRTGFGKNITLTPPKRQQGDAIPDAPELKKMLGSVGLVIAPLRPVGICDFSGQRIECVAETGYVDKGEKVKVIHVQGAQLTVRTLQTS